MYHDYDEFPDPDCEPYYIPGICTLSIEQRNKEIRHERKQLKKQERRTAYIEKHAKDSDWNILDDRWSTQCNWLNYIDYLLKERRDEKRR